MSGGDMEVQMGDQVKAVVAVSEALPKILAV
jgi:hypothetical protein